MKRRLFNLVPILLMLMSFFPSTDVHADMAPPQTPPGANLNPGDEITQVRMVAETVVLNIRQDPQDEAGAVADTVATFTMRNLGTENETMQARFPLSFASGGSDGFGNYPEIDQIRVRVNGESVSTKREMQPPFVTSGNSYQERDEVPWAVFDVSFPTGKDVTVEVAYTVSGFGYYPYEVFQYILETGAGWKDTIGSADIIVRLPYEATGGNVWLPDETTGFSQTSPGAELMGKEIRWHFENLEPTQESNIEVTIVTPALWRKVLNETDTVSRNPSDGEAWGRLGKAYKEIAIQSKHGDPRTDADGQELLGLSQQAYEKCLALLPNDPLWHFGYADLLWARYYFDIYFTGKQDAENLLPRTLTELKTALDLDPNNQRVKDLLFWISSSIPGSVAISDSGYDFLALTATPIPPTPFVIETETPIPSATAEVIASPTIVTNTPSPIATEQPPSGSSVCGGAAMLIPILVGTLVWSRRKII